MGGNHRRRIPPVHWPRVLKLALKADRARHAISDVVQAPADLLVFFLPESFFDCEARMVDMLKALKRVVCSVETIKSIKPRSTLKILRLRLSRVFSWHAGATKLASR